ncbi:hypothetical protein FKM82_010013 [Ascaphus truei]
MKTNLTGANWQSIIYRGGTVKFPANLRLLIRPEACLRVSTLHPLLLILPCPTPPGSTDLFSKQTSKGLIREVNLPEPNVTRNA